MTNLLAVDSDIPNGSGSVDTAIPGPPSRSPRISAPDVFQAADHLLLEGHRPTIDRVRMRLGRGSPNTIQEHLDVWWAHLGSRLRDVPGREFPELPERVARALQGLWNEALDSAQESLGEIVSTREQSIAMRESALEAREQELIEKEQAATARAAALHDNLNLARDQLLAANQRAERLERSLEGRDIECKRLQARIDVLETDSTDLRSKLDAAATAHYVERTTLEERHAATEARWLNEVDRARQSIKDSAREQDRQHKELRAQISQLQSQRDELKQDLQASRAELRAATITRTGLEKRLDALTRIPAKARQTTNAKSKSPVQRKQSKIRRTAKSAPPARDRSP